MFEKHGHNWMDNEKNRPRNIATLVNHQEYMVYLDKHKLVTHRFLFAPILYSEHWWLHVLDVEKRDFFVLDSKNIVSPSDERTTMNRFAVSLLIKSASFFTIILVLRSNVVFWRCVSPTSWIKCESGQEPHPSSTKGHALCCQDMSTSLGNQMKLTVEYFVMKLMELIDPTVFADCCEADKGYNTEKWAEPKLDEFRKQIVAKIMLSKGNEKRMDTIRQLNEIRNIRPVAVFRSPYVQVSSADLYSK
ncbi:hypothetical protein PIB30_059230 [Stylosanthes scabra]|uniref:Ubiquitin-like protease family profile domain-containing protein n=1 Tax=Stylosanthes scabra TaxID=79078 RepID=A0ABU6SK70_9FABA|nr:hypothetical protein [Stylosanthes scabra]